MRINGMTHRGLVREENQDHYYISESLPLAALVCDGMGGHNGGKVASKMAVDSISEDLKNHGSNEPLTANQIKNFILRSNKEIYDESTSNPALMGMGTTLSMLYIYKNVMITAQIGDSRIYRFRSGDFLQLTEDDSFVNYLLKSGEITQEEAIYHPKRSVITKALGTTKTIEPTLERYDVAVGDLYLLCSDGLTSMVRDDKIKEVLGHEGTPKEKNEKLLKMALKNGGHDNITSVLIEV